MLQRETPSHVRPRFVRFAVASCCLSAGAIVVAAARMRAEMPPPPPRVEAMRQEMPRVEAPPPALSPVIVQVPTVVAVPTPSVTRYPCQPPTVAAPRYFGRPFVEVVDESWRDDVEGVAASPIDDGRLAVWNSDQIRLSEDDGRTFTQVMEGPGNVKAVALDCGGRLWVVRGHGLLGVREEGVESWRRLPSDIPEETEDTDSVRVVLTTGGGWVAVSAGYRNDSATIAFSQDGGATWRFDQIGGSDESLDLRIDRDGVVTVFGMWTDCMSEGADLYGGHASTGLRDVTFPTEDGEPPWRAIVAHDGWVYDRLCKPADGPCAWSPSRKPRKVSVTPPLTEEDGGVLELGAAVVGPDATWVPAGLGLARLSEGQVKLYPFSDLIEPRAVDARGRVLGLAEGRVVRWSPSTGARLLPAAAAPE